MKLSSGLQYDYDDCFGGLGLRNLVLLTHYFLEKNKVLNWLLMPSEEGNDLELTAIQKQS